MDGPKSNGLRQSRTGAFSDGTGEPGGIVARPADEIAATPDRTSPRGLDRHIAGRILVSADSPAWSDLFVQVFSRREEQTPFLVPAVAEPLIVWVVSGEALVEEREVGGEWISSAVAVGDFFLTQSSTPYEMRWRTSGDEPFQVMHVYLSVPLFERIANDMLGRNAIPALRDISGGRDTELSHLLALLYRELKVEAQGSDLFVQGLSQSLVVHLVRNYLSDETDTLRHTALPAYKLRRATNYMQERLAEPFDLGRVAEVVGMSEFHFSRLFKAATGLSPSRHFIRQRVSRAQQLLQETDASIIEIGLTVGYSSPSHFAQIFRRETGMSPTRYRRG